MEPGRQREEVLRETSFWQSDRIFPQVPMLTNLLRIARQHHLSCAEKGRQHGVGKKSRFKFAKQTGTARKRGHWHRLFIIIYGFCSLFPRPDKQTLALCCCLLELFLEISGAEVMKR